MALRMDFDRHTSTTLIVRGIVGAILGTIPSAIYILWNATKLQSGDPFLIALLQIGCIGGVVIGVGSGAAAFIVAAIRSRGTGPGKVSYMKEAVTSEPMLSASVSPSMNGAPVNVHAEKRSNS